MKRNCVDSALSDLKKRKPIIIVDDYGRENEGDLVIAAEFADAQNLNFMVNSARGLMCVPIT